jgi:hypothetical protein
MATITGVTISQDGTVIATAPSGEIAPPPAHQLTITGATWTGPRRNLDYLQQAVQISATAAGQPWNNTLRITGIRGDTTIHLDP